MTKEKIVMLVGIDENPVLYTLNDEGKLKPLTEKQLGQRIHHFSDLTSSARIKHVNRWLNKKCKVLVLEVNAYLPNSSRKGDKHPPTSADEEQGAKALLTVTELFESPGTGYRLLADTLCGLHMTALRKAEPVFQAVISIKSSRPEIEEILRVWAQAVVSREEWSHKRWEVNRKAVLDYRRDSLFSPRLRDHTTLTIRSKYGKIKQPFPYRDTVALIIGAERRQMQELVPCTKDAAVIMLNSSTAGLDPTALSNLDVSAYNPMALQAIATESPRIASLLRHWWGYWGNDEDAWARGIVQEARASFGKPDSRYIRVELDPKKLRDAIRYRVLLSFFDELEKRGFMTVEDLSPYRQGAKDVFDPAPPETVVVRRAEDPEVFLEIMREVVQSHTERITPRDVPYARADKSLAAWRTISGELHLVFLENEWAKTYSKTVRAHKDIDCSFFRVEHWERQMQKTLCEHGYIKQPSAGYRYRYDYREDGSRDTTYVVAIHANLLTD